VTRIGVIRGRSIEDALAAHDRQYLVGSLSMPQELGHLDEPAVEIGISDYDVATADDPHYHPVASEHQYVLSGSALLRDLGTGEEHELQAGDFYSIGANVAHVQKSRAGTRIIFFRHPGGDAKVAVDPDAELVAWLTDLDF
jgi:mannose-6-phosphate isomerase-like protein (cupin superfamily)